MRTSRWLGKSIGFLLGALLFKAEPPLGALLGLLIGHAFDADWLRLRDDPYRSFGLDESAADADIDRAYRRLMSQHHPDRFANATPARRERAEAKARELNAAYDRIRALRQPRR
ncbi:J domain-containing protein [Lysobacter xanthus]